MKNYSFKFSELETARIIEVIELAISDCRSIVEDYKIDKTTREYHLNLAKEYNNIFVKIGEQVGLAKWDKERFNIESWNYKDL